MITYRDGYAFIDGYKFRRDEKSGYYLSTTNIGATRIRLHRYIWKKHYGPIPKGLEIHHRDENKDNNDISNLELLTKDKHLAWHSENTSPELMAKWINNLEEAARPKATEWHKSKEGRAWHSEMQRQVWKNRKPQKYKCVYCGSSFKSISQAKPKFCKPSCAAAERRASGKDDVERICIICEKAFTINKYRKTKTCSRKCGGKLRRRNNKLKTST